MSILIAGVSLLLVLAFGWFTVDIGALESQRTRAQTAADAAALAAVAESGPSGGGDPSAVARRFATLNGARLVECLCDRGATAMQVRVEVDGVIADARAVLDPNALVPVGLGFDAGGLDPRLENAVGRLLEAGRGAIRFVSGYRSTARQAELWSEALERYGTAEAADDWVAPPGSSLHERGLAVDLAGDLALAAGIVRRLGLPLWRPLPNEPWHFELTGSRG